MEKVYSNLFLEKPLNEQHKISSFKLRFVVYFVLGILNNLIVYLKGGLGIKFYLFVVWKSVVAFFRKRINLEELNGLLTGPLDSFRYFEFHYAEVFTKKLQVEHYLDISSPRYFPAYLIEKKQLSNAYILNPDTKDIQLTQSIYSKLGLGNNCVFLNDFIENCHLKPESFDLITSISVLEHIPLEIIDKSLEQIMSLLKPGGYLLLSVPVSSNSFEEYINWNEYGFQEEINNGYYFGQRFHDQKLLDQLFNSRLGQPILAKTIGEKQNGFFNQNRFEKLNSLKYPHWKESSIFFENYIEYYNLSDLPGIGVSIFLYQKN